MVDNEEIIKNLRKAIEEGNEKYLIDHKKEIINNIDYIRISQLPESLRADIDIMTAAILGGNTVEMQDLTFIHSISADSLVINPKFRMIYEHFKKIFEEKSKILRNYSEKAHVKEINKYDERIEDLKEQLKNGQISEKDYMDVAVKEHLKFRKGEDNAREEIFYIVDKSLKEEKADYAEWLKTYDQKYGDSIEMFQNGESLYQEWKAQKAKKKIYPDEIGRTTIKTSTEEKIEAEKVEEEEKEKNPNNKGEK